LRPLDPPNFGECLAFDENNVLPVYISRVYMYSLTTHLDSLFAAGRSCYISHGGIFAIVAFLLYFLGGVVGCLTPEPKPILCREHKEDEESSGIDEDEYEDAAALHENSNHSTLVSAASDVKSGRAKIIDSPNA